MPIFDQGYQHWHGTLTGHTWRWLAIAHQGVRTQWQKKATKRVLVVAMFPALVLALLLAGWGLFEQQSALLEPFLFLIQGLPAELKAGPRSFRVPIWTILFNNFLYIEVIFSMLLVLIVGPDLISQDLRFNALPLYLSRPVRRVDYFLGKLGVIAVYLAAVTIVPIVLAYGAGVCFSLDYHVLEQTIWVLLGSVAYGVILVVSAGTLMLAFSSLSKNTRLVGGLWLGVWFIGNIAAGVLAGMVRADWCPLVSYVENLGRIREVLLDTKSAWEPIARIFPSRRFAENAYSSEFPWQWSAAVLAVLFGISICILSLRIRSLDRLR